MAFPTKVIPFSTACVTWLNQTYAPKVHEHDQYMLRTENTGGHEPDWERALVLEGPTTWNALHMANKVYKINAPGFIFVTFSTSDVDHDDYLVLLASKPNYLYADGTYTACRNNAVEYMSDTGYGGYNHAAQFVHITPGTSTYMRIAVDDQKGRHSLLFIPDKGLNAQQLSGCVTVIDTSAYDGNRVFTRMQYNPRSTLNQIKTNLLSIFAGDWRSNFA